MSCIFPGVPGNRKAAKAGIVHEANSVPPMKLHPLQFYRSIWVITTDEEKAACDLINEN